MRAYIYELATGLILSGGYYEPSTVDRATQGVLTVENDVMPHPNPRLKRVQDGALRDATSAEIADYDAQLSDLDAKGLFDSAAGRVVRATVYTALRGRLGRAPTAPEIQAERTIWIAAWKQLG